MPAEARMTRALLVLLALAAVPVAASAQAPPAPASTAPPAARTRPDCSAVEHHQFDFWLGKWTVTAAGKPAGTSHIESVMNGCGVLEHWSSAGGGNGTSLNFYDRRTKTWSQAWIDEGGNALHLSGTFADGKMTLASAPRTTGSGVDVQRITWSKNGDGTVRQVWESSTDGGKTWTVAFDGTYRRQ
jgi:hypothetical protein